MLNSFVPIQYTLATEADRGYLYKHLLFMMNSLLTVLSELGKYFWK